MVIAALKMMKIIRNVKRISKKIVLVSAEYIRDELVKENMKIINHCKIRKNEKGEFLRYVWVCRAG